MKLLEKIKVLEAREILFCNIPILRYGKFRNENSIDIFPKRRIVENFFNLIINTVNPKTSVKTIWILRAPRLGEVYVFTNLLNSFEKKPEEYVIIVREKTQQELLSIFGIKSIFVQYPLHEWNAIFNKRKYHYQGITFNIYPNPLNIQLEIFRTLKDDFYPNVIKKTWNGEFCPRNIEFNQNKINQISKAYNKNSNIILLIPSANTVVPLNLNFWTELKNDFEKLGYKVIVNNPSLFTLTELLYIASVSKAVVALRSGLTEIITRLQVPMHIIYTKNKYQPEISSSDMLYSHTLKAYPKINRELIFEYDVSKTNEKYIKIIKEIIDTVERSKICK